MVDLDLDINLEIKPRSQNGVIFSVIGDQRDFLVLQMMNGEVRQASFHATEFELIKGNVCCCVCKNVIIYCYIWF